MKYAWLFQYGTLLATVVFRSHNAIDYAVNFIE